MMRKFLMPVLAVAMMAFSASAEEVDDFQEPAVAIKDSTAEIDSFIQENLKNIEAELSSAKCPDRETAVEVMRLTLDKNFTQIGKKLMTGKSGASGSSEEQKALDKIDFYQIPRDQSIYRDYPKKQVGGLAKRVRSNSVNVGIDKIDHFFGSGGILWLQSQSEELQKLTPQERKRALLDLNKRQEHNWWGLGFSGVKSYSDLSANWKGYLFWDELLDGDRPYFKCEGGKYKLSRQFKLGNYIDPLWNESNNCSSYVSEERKNLVESRLTSLGKKCPMDVEVCKQLTEKYAGDPDLQHILISPKCLDPNSKFDSIEKEVMDWKMSLSSLSGMSWKTIKNFFKSKNSAPDDEPAPRRKAAPVEEVAPQEEVAPKETPAPASDTTPRRETIQEVIQ